MLYLIKRRATSSREELVAHWFANHMPGVIDIMEQLKTGGRDYAWRYIATLFDADKTGNHPWDGIAQLWWDQPQAKPPEPHGTEPMDSFQEKAEPYIPWATKEYVIIDGSDKLSTAPLTLNAPYPMTRSGFYKVTFLVKAQPNVDYDAFFDHWLRVHVPNVQAVARQAGAFRYVVSHSLMPQEETYAGMAELYFETAGGWRDYLSHIKPDGMEAFAADEGTLVLKSQTEMVGIP